MPLQKEGEVGPAESVVDPRLIDGARLLMPERLCRAHMSRNSIKISRIEALNKELTEQTAIMLLGASYRISDEQNRIAMHISKAV